MRIYRLLLRLFSGSLRAEWSADMERLAEDQLADARERGQNRFRLLAALYWDAVNQGLRDRFDRKREPRESNRGAGLGHRGGRMGDASWDDAFAQDIRYGVRQLGRRPGYAMATVLVLSLGLGANTAVFGVLERALLRALPLPESDRLVTVAAVVPGFGLGGVDLPGFQDWAAAEGPFESLGAFHTTTHSVWFGETPERLILGRTVGDLFGTTGLDAALGRLYPPSPPGQAREAVIVLTDGFWRSAFNADRGVIGTSIRVDGETVTVIGVLPPEEEFVRLGRAVDAWAPMGEPLSWMGRGTGFLTAIGRLEPGLRPETAEGPVTTFAAGFIESGATENGLAVESLQNALVGDVRPLLWALQAAAALLLLVVAINAGNLVLARSLERTNEFAVRTALGAGRGRISRQILAETTLLALLAGLAGLGVAAMGRVVVLALVPSLAMFTRTEVLAPRSIAFTFGTAVVIGALAGILPAMRAAGRSWTAARSGGGRVAGVAAQGRRIMVAAEVGLALVLVVSAGLMTRTVVGLMQEDLGFDADAVVTAQISLSGSRYGEWDERHRFWRELGVALRAIPGVTSAGFGTALPLGRGPDGGTFRIEGLEWTGDGPPLDKMAVSPGYFESLGVPLIEGRLFDDRDRAGSRGVVVISQSVAEQHFPEGGALGRRIQVGWWGEELLEVVGVVGDVRFEGPDREVADVAYLPLEQVGAPDAIMVVKTTLDPLALTNSVRMAVLAQDAGQPIYNVRTMNDYRDGALASRSALLTLLLGLSAIGLVISCLGVFAVTSQAVRAKRREIGIRLALGATAAGVFRSVLLAETRVILAGLGLGLLTALAGTRVLGSFLFGVSPLDPVTLVASVLLLGTVALLAIARPAWVASRIAPSACLAEE